MSNPVDSVGIVPFKSSLPVVQRGIDLVQEWQSSRIRLLIGEARPQAAIVLRERFEAASDVDLLPIATTPWAVVDIAQRERPNVILLDFDGMPLADVAAATVELTELVPSAALIVLEPEDLTGTANALGATDSQWLWAVGLTQSQLTTPDPPFLDVVAVVQVARERDREDPARVVRRIRRAGGLVASTSDPPANVLLSVDDLPPGWRLWDEDPPHEWAPSPSSRAAACGRTFLFGERPGLDVPVLSVNLNVYSDEQAAAEAMASERETNALAGEPEMEALLLEDARSPEFVSESFVSGAVRVARLRAVSGRSTATIWARGVDLAAVPELIRVQVQRLDDASFDGVPRSAEDSDVTVVDLMTALKASIWSTKHGGDVEEFSQICRIHKARLIATEQVLKSAGAWCPEGEHETRPVDAALAYEYEYGSYFELDDAELEQLGLDRLTAKFVETEGERYLVMRTGATSQFRQVLARIIEAKA